MQPQHTEENFPKGLKLPMYNYNGFGYGFDACFMRPLAWENLASNSLALASTSNSRARGSYRGSGLQLGSRSGSGARM